MKRLLVAVGLLVMLGVTAATVGADPSLDRQDTPAATRTPRATPTATSTPRPSTRPFEGWVAAVVTRTVTVVNQRGQSFIFLTTPQTRILPPGAEIRVGAKVEGVAQWNTSANNWVALKIEVQAHRSFEGWVTNVVTDTVTRTVTLRNQRGQTFTFLVNPQTRIVPPGAPIPIGAKAEINAQWNASANNWVALRVNIKSTARPLTATPTSTNASPPPPLGQAYSPL